MTVEHHQQRTALIAGVTTRGGHVVEADLIGRHRRLDSLARKFGEIVPTEAAQRGSSGQTGQFNRRGRLDVKGSGARVVVSDARNVRMWL